MLRLNVLIGIVLLAAQTPVAAGDGNWTGWRFGGFGGWAKTDYDVATQGGSRFCYTATETTGTGVADVTCLLGSSELSVTASAGAGSFESVAVGNALRTAGGEASSTILGQVVDTDTVSFAIGVDSNTGPGSVSSTVIVNLAVNGDSGTAAGFGSADTDAGSYAAAVQSMAVVDSGTATALALALINVLDLGVGGDMSAKSKELGGFAGYDHQLPNGVVLGFEADAAWFADNAAKDTASDTFAGASLNNCTFCPDIAASHMVEAKTDFLGSARLRVGYAFDHVLPYVTAGVAVGKFAATASNTTTVDGTTTVESAGSRSKAYGGVVGGGVSLLAFGHVTLAAEALYFLFVNQGIDIAGSGAHDAQERVELENVMTGRLKIGVKL